MEISVWGHSMSTALRAKNMTWGNTRLILYTFYWEFSHWALSPAKLVWRNRICLRKRSWCSLVGSPPESEVTHRPSRRRPNRFGTSGQNRSWPLHHYEARWWNKFKATWWNYPDYKNWTSPLLSQSPLVTTQDQSQWRYHMYILCDAKCLISFQNFAY